MRHTVYAIFVRRLAGVAALAVIVLIGLHLYQARGSASESGQAAPPDRTAPQPCADEAVRCHLLSTGIWAVIHPPTHGDESPAGLVLWDPGGPGLRPLDAGPARELLPSWLHDRTVATFVEPWVVHNVDAECLTTAAKVSAGGELSDRQMKNWPDAFRTSCDIDLYRLDREEYEESFRELREKEGPIAGIYAQSFGAVRATAVMPELERTGGWAVLDAAAPPPGTAATTLLVKRSLAVEEGLQDLLGCDNSDAPAECGENLHQTLQDMGDDAPTGHAGGVTAYERMTALFSLSHDLESNAKPLRNILSNWPELSKADKEVINSASLAYTRRSGDGLVRPEFIGYLANYCTAYTGWGVGAGSRERNPLGAALSRMHYPCSVLPGSAASTWKLPDAPEAPGKLDQEISDWVAGSVRQALPWRASSPGSQRTFQ